ncbi:MAG: aminotransferase [Actinobacteria bacterium]|nr:aminotransferase [Actinomycetota bacterium]
MSTSRNEELKSFDRDAFFHPFTALKAHEQTGPKIFHSAKGSTLVDVDGNKFLDALAGLWCVNIGYGNTRMAAAMKEQVETLSYYHSFASMGTEAAAELAERLIRMSPVPMSKVFFGNSGSDANDTQAKLVWFYNNALGRPLKKKIIARTRGYHGVTVLSAGLTGLDNLHAGFDLPLPMIRHTRAPHRLWEAEPGMTDLEFSAALAKDLEDLILKEGPETVAAFIAEPLQAAGGVLVPPDGYFAAIQTVLDRYDVLLIADEVVTGFGRLGVGFGSTYFGMKPDLITVAKGITSAYVPLSACLVSEKVWRVLVDAGDKLGVFGHGYTYSAHPLATKSAMTNLDIIEEEHLVERAAKLGLYLQERVRAVFADHPLVAEVRGVGLIAAVEFVESKSPLKAFNPADKIGVRIARRSMELGVITRALPAADTIAFSPPFVVTESELDVMVETTQKAADQIAAEIGRG